MKECSQETISIVSNVQVFLDQLYENYLFEARSNQLKLLRACVLTNKS